MSHRNTDDRLSGSIQPPVFFSKAVDAVPRDSGGTFLSRLRRPVDVARLVVFDTWIRNNDRYVENNANSDNLLFAASPQKGRYELVPIDHSHCFVDTDFETELPAPDLVCDEVVYGLYPEFEPYMTADAVAQALSDLQSLDQEFVAQCINSVPAEWHLDNNLKEPLVELICERAKFVIGYLPFQLVPDPQFSGL